MTSETKLGDKTLYLATGEVSDDGSTMTRTTGAPAKEDQEIVLTLREQESGGFKVVSRQLEIGSMVQRRGN